MKRVFWALYHTILIALLIYWFLKKQTFGVCFIGTLLIYTQQWWLAGRENDVTETHEPSTVQPEPHCDEWCTDCKEYDQEKRRCPRYNKVIRTALQGVRPKQSWISAKERPPDAPDNYLVTVVYKNALDEKASLICMDYWTGWGWDDCGNGNDLEVIAWMTLPKKYKEEI